MPFNIISCVCCSLGVIISSLGVLGTLPIGVAVCERGVDILLRAVLLPEVVIPLGVPTLGVLANTESAVSII